KEASTAPVNLRRAIRPSRATRRRILPSPGKPRATKRILSRVMLCCVSENLQHITQKISSSIAHIEQSSKKNLAEDVVNIARDSLERVFSTREWSSPYSRATRKTLALYRALRVDAPDERRGATDRDGKCARSDARKTEHQGFEQNATPFSRAETHRDFSQTQTRWCGASPTRGAHGRRRPFRADRAGANRDRGGAPTYVTY